MSRLPGLGFAQTLAALTVLAAIVVVGALSLGPLGNSPGGSSPSPTTFAAAPTSPGSPGAQSTSSAISATPTPEPSPSAVPSGEVVAFTNPDGISTEGFAGDDYPFIAEAQTLPNFAGIWAEDDGRAWHVAVTADIPGAIEALKDGIPRGITVYFQLAPYTQAEVCELRDRIFEDRDKLMQHGIVLTQGGCENIQMRVTIGMSPLTPESVAYMEARYPGPVDYSEDGGGSFAFRPVDPPTDQEPPLQAVTQSEGFGLLTCGRRPFPPAALDSTPINIAADGPMYAALREALTIYVDLYGDLSASPWILAEQDIFGATFLLKQDQRWLEAPVYAGKDRWAPGTIGECSPHEFTAADYGQGTWSLDPDFPAPKADTTEIHVIVREMACAGGTQPLGRVVPPVVTYYPGRLEMTIGVRYPGGPATCPGLLRGLPVTVVLPEPLGNRELTGATPPRD